LRFSSTIVAECHTQSVNPTSNVTYHTKGQRQNTSFQSTFL